MARDTAIKAQKAQRKRTMYIEAETIEGTIQVLPNPYFRAREVYLCQGLGDLFNGKYYVRKAKHTISSNGYSVELEVQNVDHVDVKKNIEGVKPVPLKPSSGKMYKVVKGDCLSKIAKRFGTTWQKIYALNRGQLKSPNSIYPNQVLRLP